MAVEAEEVVEMILNKIVELAKQSTAVEARSCAQEDKADHLSKEFDKLCREKGEIAYSLKEANTRYNDLLSEAVRTVQNIQAVLGNLSDRALAKDITALIGPLKEVIDEEIPF